MASSWTHAVAAVAVAATLVPRGVPPRVWLVTAVGAIVPDLDAIGRLVGAGDVAWLGGHRALTHSLVFACGLAALLSLTMLRRLRGIQPKVALWLALTLAIATHGGLDAMTTYGEGVEFLAPWTTTRYWAPWSVLGGGIARDSIAFVLSYALARTVIMRRGLPLPRLLNPRFLQPAV